MESAPAIQGSSRPHLGARKRTPRDAERDRPRRLVLGRSTWVVHPQGATPVKRPQGAPMSCGAAGHSSVCRPPPPWTGPGNPWPTSARSHPQKHVYRKRRNQTTSHCKHKLTKEPHPTDKSCRARIRHTHTRTRTQAHALSIDTAPAPAPSPVQTTQIILPSIHLVPLSRDTRHTPSDRTRPSTYLLGRGRRSGALHLELLIALALLEHALRNRALDHPDWLRYAPRTNAQPTSPRTTSLPFLSSPPPSKSEGLGKAP